MRILFFGNCQAKQFHRFFDVFFNIDNLSTLYLSNNPRTGMMKSVDIIVDNIQNSDIIIYQPLSEKHNLYSEESIMSLKKSNCLSVSFPYIFNSGAFSLSHAPKAIKNPYGVIYGEEIIIELNKIYSKVEIINLFKQGEIDFNQRNRFDYCMKIVKKREQKTQIKVADYILDNYQDRKLFITHNHPKNCVFMEMTYQLANIINCNVRKNIDIINISELMNTNCITTPYDKQELGYKFDYDNDWLRRGKELIDLILNCNR